MPANFPEFWLSRIIQLLNEADVASFLNGISEIPVNVTTINAGQLTEKNKIYVPETMFEVDILINNTTYPIPVQVYEDGTIEITLDKYQTKVVSLPDDQTMGASYDIIDTATAAMRRSIMVGKYQKAIHSIAPAANSVATPILNATGGPDALEDENGRLRLTYEDLVAAKKACKNFGKKRIVLCEDHWNDLLLDRKRFGDKLVNYTAGMPAPVIASFELHSYDGVMPIYTSAVAKKPYGAILEAGDKEGSVIFGVEGIAKKTGMTKQYFDPAKPRTQANEYALRHYYVVTPYQNKRIGAII